MTVCIAALCEDRQAMVLAADRMVSTQTFEAELAISKISRVHKNWWAMMAGNNITAIFPMIDKIRTALGVDLQLPLSVDRVTGVLEGVFREERQHQAETVFLGPYGMTLREFVDEGRPKLGDAIFERIHNGINWSRMECALLVAGFDGTDRGHVMCLSDPGKVDRYDVPGFHAIGSGAANALSMLYFREQDHTDPLWTTLYQVNEAKIFGGYAPGVGWATELIILRPNYEPRQLTDKEVLRLDQLWINEGQPRIPKRLKTRLAVLTAQDGLKQRPERNNVVVQKTPRLGPEER